MQPRSRHFRVHRLAGSLPTPQRPRTLFIGFVIAPDVSGTAERAKVYAVMVEEEFISAEKRGTCIH